MLSSNKQLLLLLCLFSVNAFAYIDPNSGFVLSQLLMGGFLGCLLFAKRIWNFVTRKKKS